MANVLTNLIPSIQTALDVVSRELVGFIAASTRDARTERAAIGQQVYSFVTPAQAAEDIVAGQLPPDTGDQTIGNVPIQITKARSVPFRWNGEEFKGLENAGTMAEIRRDQIAQAFRTLANEVERDLAVSAYVAASRATGTAGSTPFSTNLSDSAQLRKVLDDNGAPLGDRQLVIDTSAGASLRTLTQLTKANEAASDSTLRQGVLLDLHGFAIRESAGVQLHTKGTGAGYLVNNGGGLPVGSTVIPVDTGTGTIVAGDVVTFAGDTVNKYVVTSALSGGSFSIGAPGLRVAIADNAAVTVGANHVPSVGFHRSSLLLAARLPALPDGRDSAIDRMTVTDPVSGISFEFSVYDEYRRLRYFVGLAWGTKGLKSNHTAILLG